MNEIKQYPLSLNGDTFNALKSDFEQMLRQLLTEMEKRDSEDATMTVKLAVELKKDQARDYMCNGYDGTRDITKPSFKHEISTVMQVKNKKTGSLGGNYELVWDKDIMQYVMREIDNGQISMFSGKDVQEQQPERPALPSGDVIDADYEVVGAHEEQVDSESYNVEKDVSDERPDDAQERFDFMLQFVGQTLRVCEADGYYTVRTEENRVVLSSAFAKEDAFFCDADKLAPHVGHNVVCVGYGEDVIVNVSVECEDCNTVLFDINAPEQSDAPDDYEYPVEEAE